MKKLLITTLACTAVALASQAATVTFNNFGSGDLGSTEDFTSGGITLSATASPGHNLFGKTAGGDETGLGLTGTTDNEITPSTWVALTVPTVPPSIMELVFLGSVQSGEIANIYFTTDLSDPTQLLLGSVTSDGSFSVAGKYSGAGFIVITGGGTGGANVLLNSVTVTPTVPDSGTTVALLGGALTLLGFARRKLLV
jgi:hypothetical protein